MSDKLDLLLADGVIDEVLGRLKSGKEANISLVRRGDLVLAAKVYKDRATRSFKNNSDYKEGRKVRNSRTQRAMDSGGKFGRDAAEQEWKSAEADALYKLSGSGVRVPEPVMFYEGVLLMDVVRDAEGQTAPRLIDVPIEPDAALGIYADLVAQMITMLCCDLIHGDLSPYNILAAADGPTIIDFPQVVSAVHSSRAEFFFLRDFDNVVRFLAGYDPSLGVHTADGRAIWRAYVSRELTPQFVPPPPPPPRPTRGPDRRSGPDERGRSGRPAQGGGGRPQGGRGRDDRPPQRFDGPPQNNARPPQNNGGRPPQGNAPNSGDRAGNDRAQQFGSRPAQQSDGSAHPNNGNRARDDRPQQRLDGRPQQNTGDRARDDRPQQRFDNRPQQNNDNRPQQNNEQQNNDNRPRQNNADRPQPSNGDRPRTDHPPQRSREDAIELRDDEFDNRPQSKAGQPAPNTSVRPQQNDARRAQTSGDRPGDDRPQQRFDNRTPPNNGDRARDDRPLQQSDSRPPQNGGDRPSQNNSDRARDDRPPQRFEGRIRRNNVDRGGAPRPQQASGDRPQNNGDGPQQNSRNRPQQNNGSRPSPNSGDRPPQNNSNRSPPRASNDRPPPRFDARPAPKKGGPVPGGAGWHTPAKPPSGGRRRPKRRS